MPNWCDNSIYIESDEETIAEIKLAIKESRLLQYMHPMPAELEGTTAPNEGVNWYGWRVENWGTKWEVEATGDSSFEDNDKTMIQIWFDSAWAPPVGAYEHFYDRMIEQDKPIEIRANYIEWGMMFCGEWTNGEDQYYTIPDTVELAREEIPEKVLELFGIIQVLEEMEENAAEQEERDNADDV